MLQKIRIGEVEEELLTINVQDNMVYIETFRYMYTLQAGDNKVANAIYKELKDIYVTFRFKNPTVYIDLYEILGSLSPYKFICTEMEKYDYVLQIAMNEGIFTVVKCYTDGNKIYLILDGYTFSYIALDFVQESKDNLNFIVDKINKAGKESKVLLVDQNNMLTIYTHGGAYTYLVNALVALK